MIQKNILSFFTFLFVALASVQASQASRGVSAVRPAGQNWKISAAQFDLRSKLQFKLFKAYTEKNPSAYDSRSSHIELKDLPEFGKNDAEYFQLFQDIRDKRFLQDPDVKNFSRRISWMYPYDGCFARADFVARLIENADPKAHFGRVFIFGNLSAKTKNSSSGEVSWWYHVAVIFKSQGKAFVIDPSLDYYRPLVLNDWVKLMVDNEQDAELAICSETTYTPDSDCKKSKMISQEEAEGTISEYLHAERENLIDLGRDPEVELGNNPPWL